MKKIVFVCTGNTCRSSMAEALFKALLSQEGLDADYCIESAGTCAYGEQPASYNAVLALDELGIDLSSHASRSVDKEMLQEADLILTMTNSHKSYLQGLAPQISNKIFTLKEYCGETSKVDICDPFGGNISVYRTCRDEILNNLRTLIIRIKKDQ